MNLDIGSTHNLVDYHIRLDPVYKKNILDLVEHLDQIAVMCDWDSTQNIRILIGSGSDLYLDLYLFINNFFQKFCSSF